MTENRKIHINQHSLKHANYERYKYRMVVPSHHRIEDILKTEYYAHIAAELKPGTIIEALFEDYTKYLELIVVGVGNVWAKVKILNKVDLSSERKESEDKKKTQKNKFAIKWINPAHKYGVIRLSDNQVIEKYFSTNDDAEEWLKNNISKIS